MNRTIALAAACSAMLVTPSLAFDWTGSYIGFGAGYGTGGSSITGNAAGIPSDHIFGPSAFARIGYDFPSSQMIFGVEGDLSIGGPGLSIATIDQGVVNLILPSTPGAPTQNTLLIKGPPSTRETFAYGIDADFDLVGRAGVPFDRLMPYVLGGISVSHMSARITHTSISDGSIVSNLTASSVGLGYLLGVGIEAKITPTISTFLEAKYRDYGPHDIASVLGGSGATWFHSPQVASITSGLNFHF